MGISPFLAVTYGLNIYGELLGSDPHQGLVLDFYGGKAAADGVSVGDLSLVDTSY